jgi:large subunit ribosomal protein L6
MSRVGKMPVTIPAGVDVSIKDDQISVKGAGGTLQLAGNALVEVVLDAGGKKFAPANESREANAMSGTMRQLVNNMVIGVSKGFEKKLSLVGVGYKAQAQAFQAESDGRLFASGQQRNARRHHGPDRQRRRKF